MPHHWEAIPLGRVCLGCKLVQATGEFDDTVECIGPEPPEPPKR